MFAASRCPSCGRLHGLELPAASTTCRLCGKRYAPSKGTIMRTFSSDTELRAFLQRATSIDGGSSKPIVDLDGKGQIRISQSGFRPGRARIVKLVLIELKRGPRSWADLSCITQEGYGPEMLEECLGSLMEQGVIYQMTDGRYSIVE